MPPPSLWQPTGNGKLGLKDCGFTDIQDGIGSQKEKNPSSPSGSPPESTSGIPAIIGQLPKGIFEIDQSRFSGDNVAKLDMLVSKRHSSISLICWEYVGNVSLSSG